MTEARYTLSTLMPIPAAHFSCQFPNEKPEYPVREMQVQPCRDLTSHASHTSLSACYGLYLAAGDDSGMDCLKSKSSLKGTKWHSVQSIRLTISQLVRILLPLPKTPTTGNAHRTWSPSCKIFKKKNAIAVSALRSLALLLPCSCSRFLLGID